MERIETATGKFMKTMNEECGFMTRKEAMEFFGIRSYNTLWLWQNKGMPSVKIGKRRLYKKSDCLAFIQNGGLDLSKDL